MLMAFVFVTGFIFNHVSPWVAIAFAAVCIVYAMRKFEQENEEYDRRKRDERDTDL